MSTKPLKKIKSIKFGVLSPDVIRKMSVTQIITADTYDEDGLPISSGLMDPRLGVVEPGKRCKTCGNTVGECVGHFGHIELARPVIHVNFAKTIYDVLRATCPHCGRLKLPEEKVKEYYKRQKDYRTTWGYFDDSLISEVVQKASKVKICPHCGAPQYKIRFEKPTSYSEDRGEEGAVRLTPIDVRARLEKVTDDDAFVLGIDPEYARPEWMVLTVLPVPPISVRPSITLETGLRSEDDLTHKLVDIIRINQRLRENIDAGAPQLIVEDLWELLQYHITTYFDNEVAGIPPARHRSGRALRTLAQRLKGKEGRFRSNLSGKRVDFSARTVISPDPNLSINEVGVPEEIATILTVPERVTTWNIEEMKELVINGPDKHPGANYIIRTDNRRIDLRFVKDREKTAEALEPGFIIERHLRDGDIVLFNRQPSLHRISIMAHEVRVLPYRTFRLNLSVCPPYNADFDGDEMNLHVPQSEEARAEARILMLVQKHILTPRYGTPIIGALQDHLSAAYLFTRKDTLLMKDEVMRLLSAAGYTGEIPEPAYRNPDRWTGKQIFSLFLPKGLNMTFKAKICEHRKTCLKENCPIDAYVVIKDGQLLHGVIDENAIGAQKSESMFHRIVKDYGTDVARKFLDSITRLLLEFISSRGFTMAIDDVELPKDGVERIKSVIDEKEAEVEELIKKFRHGELQRLPGRTLRETLETRIMKKLSEARDEAGKIAGEYLGLDNYAVIMAKTGARGKMLNLAQMTACVGQQAVRGMRPNRGYRGRALPHFKPDDLSPEAHGFVKSSFRRGLTPVEFFFHAMGGREGLVDTAVRTSSSGYMQRRLINALQDIKVEYDGTVRDASGRIIQFAYGEDYVDPARADHERAVNIDAIINKHLVKAGVKNE